MAYVLTPSLLAGSLSQSSILSSDSETFPATWDNALVSCWFEIENFDTYDFIGNVIAGVDPISKSGGIKLQLAITSAGVGVIYVQSLKPTSGSYLFCVCYLSQPLQAATNYNVTVSVKLSTGVVQVYLNGVSINTAGSEVNPGPVENSTYFECSNIAFGNLCVANVYAAFPSTFFDLSAGGIAAFYASGPVDPGSNGQLPTGTAPSMFLTVAPGGVASDILLNRGTGGAAVSFNLGGHPPLCAGAPQPPVPAPAVVGGIGTLSPLAGIYRGQVGINFYGRALVGDMFSGLVGRLNFNSFTEYGQPMIAQIASPPVHSKRKRLFMPKFEIDIEAGVGQTSGQGFDPVWMLEISKDGGETWGAQQPWRSMGRIGEYVQRLRWLKLGQARQWVFRLTASDPVRRVIIGVWIAPYEGLS